VQASSLLCEAFANISLILSMTAKYHRFFLTIAVWMYALSFSHGQKQLLLIKGEKVLARFNPGDEFVISLKGDKKKLKSYVNNLFDTAVLVHKTVVPIHKIDKVYFKQSGLVNLIGKFLVVAGVAYFLIDQFNVIVVDGNEATLNDNVTNTSVALVAVGLPMVLIKKKYRRIHGRTRLMVVNEKSPFYLAPLLRSDD
jgi:hypothetical protein